MIEIKIHRQPTDSTCGPTSLHAVYRYYQDDISLEDVIAEVEMGSNGGTIAPLLATHALKRGYKCTIYPYNMHVFDPTWFYPKPISVNDLIAKLEQQCEVVDSDDIRYSSKAHIEYLKLGGLIAISDLNVKLLNHYFKKKTPILTGVSATYLYLSAREREDAEGKLHYDDIHGVPAGHFVVLYGYEQDTKKVVVADPLSSNPLFQDKYYRVPVSHLMNAVMLGVLTHDANLLIIEPGK